jgi:hypothetical protein
MRVMMRNRGCGQVHITFFLVALAFSDSDLRREGSGAMTTQHTLTDEEFWTLLDALQTASETYMGAAVNLVLATDARVARHFRAQADDARRLAEMVADADTITVTRAATVKHRGH